MARRAPRAERDQTEAYPEPKIRKGRTTQSLDALVAPRLSPGLGLHQGRMGEVVVGWMGIRLRRLCP